MAGRILGMGDVLSIIEKAEQNLDMKKAEEMAEKLKAGRFTLNDYLDQMAQVRNMGSIQDILSSMPGFNTSAMKNAVVDESIFTRHTSIILSMTQEERENPEILGSSRKRRVARGSGVRVEEINKLLKNYEMMKTMAKNLARGKMPKGFMGL
jgi:signal recognition particle subunit SRP54